MQVLEDHNRQLEAQLQRLRQLLDQVEQVGLRGHIHVDHCGVERNRKYFLFFSIIRNIPQKLTETPGYFFFRSVLRIFINICHFVTFSAWPR